MKKKNKEKKVLEPQYYTSRINTSTYNYKVYYMSVPEKIINVLIAFVIGACIGYLFYGGIGKDEYGQATTVTYCLNVIIPVIVGVIAVKLYIPVRIQSIIKKQKNQLNKQFRDMLEALSTSLGAGKNVIDSFRSVYDDMKMQYEDGAYIISELELLLSGMGQTDGRTDIYCLGATLYHLVTGKNPCEPPYEIRPIREINPSLSGGLERIILKCTQPNPANRYQNAAELMYALEHYDEIDDIYRKKQKRKLAAFITTSVITVILGATSIWGYVSAENKKSENYDNILKTADTYEDYYNAIITDPTRTDAYLKLNDMLTSDFVLDKDEANILTKIQVGLDRKNSDGYSQTYDVLSDLKKKNPDGYQEVCYQYGESFLFYYDINVEKDRYANATKWYKDAVQKYPVAQIYCDISDCLDLISQYGGAKVKQTEKMYEEYANLWKKVTELEKESEQFDSVDSKLQVWNEVDDIVNNNISPLLEVTSKDDVIALLDAISDSSTKVDKSVIADDMKKLQDNIESTKQKINTVKEAEKE